MYFKSGTEKYDVMVTSHVQAENCPKVVKLLRKHKGNNNILTEIKIKSKNL